MQVKCPLLPKLLSWQTHTHTPDELLYRDHTSGRQRYHNFFQFCCLDLCGTTGVCICWYFHIYVLCLITDHVYMFVYLPTPTVVTGEGFSVAFVCLSCLSVCLYVCFSARCLKTRCIWDHQAWHRNVPREWIPRTHSFWCQKVRGQGHEAQNTLPACVFVRLWVVRRRLLVVWMSNRVSTEAAGYHHRS